jgi:hypothetical protein
MIRIISIIGFCILLLSCRKEGCMDINSASYDPDAKVNDGICSYRYLKTISITRLPDIYQLAMYDQETFGGPYPDMQFRMTKKYNNPVKDYFDLITDIEYDVFSPFVWEVSITNEYLLTNSEYQYELVDIDRDREEIILSGIFIPSEVYRDNKIVLHDPQDQFEIVLTYISF